MREKILKLFLENQKEYISGSKLASKLGISRVAIWKHIEALKEEGYDITGISGKGYKIINPFNIIVPENIVQIRQGNNFGKNIINYSELDSTNSEAKRLVDNENLEEGTIIIARKQNKGRGRIGRVWVSPEGGLWFSIILKPNLPIPEIALISLVFSKAIADALNKYLPAKTKIKWPNDIYYNDKKLGGILLEMSGEMDAIRYVIAGIGININIEKESFNEHGILDATSIFIETNQKLILNDILIDVLYHLETQYEIYLQNGFSEIRKDYILNCLHMNKEIIVKQHDKTIRGISHDIDINGNLILKAHNKTEVIHTGDIVLINS